MRPAVCVGVDAQRDQQSSPAELAKTATASASSSACAGERARERKNPSILAAKIGQVPSPRFLPRPIPPRREHGVVDVERVHEATTMLSTSLDRPAYKMEKYGLKPPPARTDS